MAEATILVAEDDEHIRTGLIDTLESEGYTVRAAADGAEALEMVGRAHYDLVLLDVMMPKASGYDVCRAIREDDRRIPILMLTAKGEEIDKVVGFELGADDYVTKPFGIRELLARISALLRRSALLEEDPLDEDAFEFGQAKVQRRQYAAEIPEHGTIPLSAREIALIDMFRSHANEVLSRERLLTEVWGYEYSGTTRTLDQHIAQLRKKVEPDVKQPTVIITVHGIGYRYVTGTAGS